MKVSDVPKRSQDVNAKPKERGSRECPDPEAHLSVLLHDFGAGGSERIAIRLANAWIAAGRRVSFICGSATGPLLDLVDPRAAVIEADPSMVQGPNSRRRLTPLLTRLIAKVRPDLLFVPGNFHIPLIVPTLNLPFSKRPRLVVKLSNPILRDDRHALRQRAFEWLLERRLRQADAIVAMSPSLAAEAKAAIGHAGIVSIPEPILADSCTPPPAIDPASTLLLAAGRFVAQKNFRLAVEALALVPNPQASLTILGDGPERQRIQQMAERRGVSSRLSLPGYLGNIGSMLSRTRVFVLPSLFEGYPAVAVEAIAAGVPVVATDCSPAIREIITGPELGTIVASRDPRAMARAIQNLLERPPPDPIKLAAAVAHHRIGPIAAEYLKLFDRLLAPPSDQATGQPMRRAAPNPQAPGTTKS